MNSYCSQYHFRVMAENQYGVGPHIQTDTPITAKFPFNVPSPPGRPEIVDHDSSSVQLTWSKPTSDGGSKIQGYQVEYKEPTEGRWRIAQEVLVKDCRLTVSGLLEGRTYEFRVKAKNAAGFSLPSAPTESFKLTPKFTVPSPPQNPQVTKVSRAYIDLTWEKPRSDGGSRITGYIIERRDVTSSFWYTVTEYPATDLNFCDSRVKEGVTYEYRIIAINAAGRSDPSACTNPIKATSTEDGTLPEFVRKLYDKNVTIKKGAILECEAIGKPLPTARWLKNGRDITPSARIRYVDKGQGVFQLMFEDIEDGDEGEYCCEASNSMGSTRTRCTLRIAAPPRIERCPNDVFFPEHDNGKIKIYFSGTSPFEVTLFKDGLEVKDTVDFKVTVFDDYAIVFLKDIKKDKEGKYQIQVRNDSGMDTGYFNVWVTGLPGPPIGPLVTSEITQHTCHLSWHPPKFDGGCRVTHYVVERKETTHEQWVVATSCCKDTQFTCQGLQENGEYIFRVMAVNENGMSVPLEGLNPIIAKLPFDPPGPPGIPDITEVGGDFVNLQWTKPENDGGSRVLGYYVEKREVGSNLWQRINQNYLCLPTQFNIGNLVEDREYEFRIFAVNEAGISPPSQNSRQVKIKDPNQPTPPEFTIPLKQVMGVERKNVQFMCKVSGQPVPEIQWYKGTRELHQGAKYSMLRDGDMYMLAINDIFGEDADEYCCRAVNIAGARTSRAELLIKSPPHLNVPPRFRDLACFDKGENVQIKIPFTGFPRPKITWSKDDVEIEKGAHFDIQVKERHAILTIKDASQLDDGPYRIVAENELGVDSAVIIVQISDRPDPPRHPGVESFNETSCILTWMPPLWDGGSHITNYVIEKCEAGMSHWVRVTNTRFLTHKITGLNPGTQYQFRVCAENIYGRSEPSEASTPITTRATKQKKQKKVEVDEHGKKKRGQSEGPVSDYDKFVQTLTSIPEPVDIKSTSVYDYYDILEELGTGAFGVVHRCRERKTGNIYAAKFIPVANQYEKAVIKKEIDIMNQLLHHNKLIRLHDAFEDDDEMILIYEFMAGGELFERIACDDHRMTESEVINYMRQICEGIKHMHERNILHLDLKPENIMCTKKAGNEIKIIDFGLATRVSPDETVKISTGTAEFAAPEIVDREPVGFYTDMWACGVLSYVLLSGLSPFAGNNDIETLRNVKNCDWQFDQEAFSGISEEGKDFIKRLLVKDKDKRMTAHECLEHPWLKGQTKTDDRTISSKKYVSFRDRMRDRYKKYWDSAILPFGHTANYSSLRKLQEKLHRIEEFVIDKREMVPRFVIKPHSTMAYEGQAAKFYCRVIAPAPATLTWYRDSGELRQSVKYMKRYMGDDYTFIINRCRLDDRGEYMIRAENHYGFREEPVFLNVHPMPQQLPQFKVEEPVRRRMEPLRFNPYDNMKDCAPNFSFHLRNRVIQLHLGVKLLACLEEKPVCDVKWFKDGRELSKYDVRMTHSDGVVTCEIASCSLEDAGKYTCQATNALGMAETSCHLYVEGEEILHKYYISGLFDGQNMSN